MFKSRGAGWIPYRTGIKKILEAIQNHKGQQFPINELFDVYYNHGVTFTEDFGTINLDSLDDQFLFYLMYDKKPTIRRQDIDHIMPKSILEAKKYDWAKINSICNFQLLDSGTNRGEKNAKPFIVWFNNFVTDKPAFVNRHLIPIDEAVWTEDNFEEFIIQRSQLIIDKINFHVVHGVLFPLEHAVNNITKVTNASSISA